MFPLKQRKIGGYRFLQPTFYGTKHSGTDYTANYVEYYAPFDGFAVAGFGPEGGNFWTLTRPNGDVLTARHLSKSLKTGYIQEGEKVAITGNTGKYTTNPHLHQEVKVNGKLVDPETYNWNPIVVQYPMNIRIKLVINSPLEWQSLNTKIDEISHWYETNSKEKINLQFYVYFTIFDNVPFKFLPDGSAVIDEPWFDKNITDPLMDTTILVVRDEDLPDNFPGGFKLVARTSGFMGEKPTKTVVACSENDQSEIYPQLNAFVDYVRHELMHTCYIFSGEHIGNQYFGTDQTHKYFYDLKNPEGAFMELNYEHIFKTLTKTKGVEMIVQKQGGNTLYLFGEGKLFPIASDYNTYQKEFGNTPINVMPPDQFAKFPVSTLKLKV